MSKVVLITGASSGIGRATALHFHDAGWQVAATMRNPEEDTELTSYDNMATFRLDVTQTDTIEQSIADTLEVFGQLDVVVNNAGYTAQGPIEAATDEQIINQFQTNVVGVMRVTRAVIPYMRQQGGGTIINVSSVGGFVPLPMMSLYVSSKWALEGFSESVRHELELFNIRIKIVEPDATIDTGIVERADNLWRNDLDVYNEFAGKVTDGSPSFYAHYSVPSLTAQVIYDAAVDDSDQIRYTSGLTAENLAKLRREQTDQAFYQYVKTSFGLD